MSTSTSPALQKIESALGLSKDTFADKNYHSVFDIVRLSRKQFSTSNLSWLGSNCEKVWDLAMGQAQHIRRLFRENQLSQQVRQALPRTLSGYPVRTTLSTGGIQGLIQKGPDWQSQFEENWQSHCQSGAPEAYDSPVSYLTWLYNQALNFEQEMSAFGSNDIITLSERRPDLATMIVDNDAVNLEIPTLQLVNEILEKSIATSIPSEKTVDETLAVTRYPTLLPYHFPHDQAELSLLNTKVALEEIIGETSTDWPWFLNSGLTGTRSNNATQLASQLAPEQQTITIEADNSTTADLTSFYEINLGLATAEYAPFECLETFTHQLGITVPQTEQLLASNTGGTTVTVSPNVPNQVFLANKDLVFGEMGNLAPGRFANSLPLYNRQGSNAWFPQGGTSDKTLKGDASFSFSMWLKFSTNPSDHSIPLFCNSKINGESQGFCVSNNQGCFRLDVADDKGNKNNNANKLIDTTTSSTIISGKWYFICLTWDSKLRKAYVYYQEKDKTTINTITVDMANITGDITTAEEFTWMLNDTGDGGEYYNSYPVPTVLVECCYDDIGVFPGVLSSADIQKLATSQIPLSQVTGLTLKPIYYCSLDNVDSTNYGASFINAGKTPDVQLSSISSSVQIETVTGENLTFGTGSATYVPSIWPAKIDSGMKLFGTKQNFIQLGTQASASLSGAADITLGFWFCLDGLPSSGTSPIASNCSTYNIGKSGIGLGIQASGQLYASAQSSIPAAYCTITSEQTIKLNTWYYLTLQWKASTFELTLSFSENGATPVTKTSIISDTSGTIAPDTGTAWTFNESGTCSYYTTDKVNPISFVIDDICIWKKLLTEEDIHAVAASSFAAGGRSDMDFHYPLGTASLQVCNLTNSHMDRINRMVRLKRWLNLSYEETDLLLSACVAAQGTSNTNYSLNTHTLRVLGVFRHWQRKHGVTAFQFATVLHQITPYAISPAVPFLDQIFNTPSLFETPFSITGESVCYGDTAKKSDRQIISQLCAGLNLTRAQFQVLADKVATQQGDASAQTFNLTLDVVSALYRLTMIPRWLGLSFAEGSALLSLVGNGTSWASLAKVPQLSLLSGAPPQPETGDILDTLMAMDAAADWAKEQGLSWINNYLVLQSAPDSLTATDGTVNFVNTIKQQLPASLLSEQNFDIIPVTNNTLEFFNGFTRDDYKETYGVKLDSDIYQYAVFSDAANAILSGNTDYTLGFWLKISGDNTVSAEMPLLANADWQDTGIFISAYGGVNTDQSFHSLYIHIYDSQKNGVSSSKILYTPDVWTYFSFVLDANNKVATLYLTPEDGIQTSTSVDYSQLTGSIVTNDGNFWHLNESGPATFHKKYGDPGIFSYSDISLWHNTLLPNDIVSIAESGKPATQTVAASLSYIGAFTNWMSLLDNLVNSDGLVLPAAIDYNTIYEMVEADISQANFDVSSVDTEQVTSTLTGIIYLAKLSQNGIADSALAQMFSTSQALSPYLLRWAKDSEYRLLSDSLMMNNRDTLTDPATISASYLEFLYNTGQRANIATQLSLTPAALSTFLEHPDWLDPDFTDLELTLVLLYRISCYRDWLKIAIKEDSVLGYLDWINGTTTPDTVNAAKTLAILLDWDSDEVAQATAGGPAKSVKDIDYVMRLQSLSAQTGLSVAPLLDIGSLKPGNVTDTWDAWQAAGNALVAAQATNI